MADSVEVARVAHGIFAGLVGRVVARDHRGDVHVAIEIAGRPVTIVVPPVLLERRPVKERMLSAIADDEATFRAAQDAKFWRGRRADEGERAGATAYVAHLAKVEELASARRAERLRELDELVARSGDLAELELDTILRADAKRLHAALPNAGKQLEHLERARAASAGSALLALLGENDWFEVAGAFGLVSQWDTWHASGRFPYAGPAAGALDVVDAKLTVLSGEGGAWRVVFELLSHAFDEPGAHNRVFVLGPLETHRRELQIHPVLPLQFFKDGGGAPYAPGVDSPRARDLRFTLDGTPVHLEPTAADLEGTRALEWDPKAYEENHPLLEADVWHTGLKLLADRMWVVDPIAELGLDATYAPWTNVFEARGLSVLAHVFRGWSTFEASHGKPSESPLFLCAAASLVKASRSATALP